VSGADRRTVPEAPAMSSFTERPHLPEEVAQLL
jgi:hypothetical protein